MIENEFIPYEQALELAKLNFNEKCFGYYGLENELYIEISCNLDSNLTRRNFIATPTFSQSFRWFREVHKLQAEILWRGDMECFCYKTGNFKYGSHDFSKDDYNTYEEAELACLNKLIEIIKNKL
jgi:hypothetical protein